MSDLKTLIENLMAQKELYSALLACSDKLNGLIASGSDEFAPLIEQRGAIMEKLESGDEKIGLLLSSPGARDLFEKNEQADKLRKEIVAIVEKVKESGSLLIESARKARGKTVDDLGSLRDGKKTVSGYGKTSKPVYAKFIDFKH